MLHNLSLVGQGIMWKHLFNNLKFKFYSYPFYYYIKIKICISTNPNSKLKKTYKICPSV